MSMEDTNQSPQAPADPSSSSSSLERRPSADEDSAVMTIEFLRARLLSERSVSKAARQRAQQLSKKISELEERLEAEIQLRRKLEADRVEILSKYRAELSEEYGEIFASTFGESLSRNESHMPNEEEEGLSNSRLNRSDSSQQLNLEEVNDEDEETDQSGREKGVLSWGRQKGSRREFGHGIDWPGRSLSQRSFASTDGESPQKKWAGKSVRQIRKRDSSNSEGEPGQSQVSEDLDGKSGQPDDMKERLQCEDEKDTEVERVLERQAELIEQFEAEENAQRAWEAKFKEAKALAHNETGITKSNSRSNLETVTRNIQYVSLAKDGATMLIEAESSINEGATRYSRKVYPEDCPSNSEEIQGGLVQSETVASEHASGVESEKNKIVPTVAFEKGAFSSTNQNKIGSTALGQHILGGKSGVVESTKKVEIPNERLTEVDPADEDVRLHAGETSCSVSKEDLSEDLVVSNTDTEQRVEQSKASAIELGKSSKYNKRLSSSFRFTVFPDAEPVTSSPHMPGFASYHKQDINKVEEGEVGKEEILLNGSTATSEQKSGFGFSEPHPDEPHPDESHCHVAATASLEGTFSTKDSDSQENLKDKLHEVTRQREHWDAENGVMDRLSNHDLGNEMIGDSNREEVLKRRPLALGGGQDLSRQFSDLPSYSEFREPGVGLQPGVERHYPDIPANSGNFASLPGNRSGVPGPVLNAKAYDDTALRSQGRSAVDGGFDRVTDVLRALQIAKYQIESSDEQATPFAIDTPYRNGYDRRDSYSVEPPCLPSMYAVHPQYTSPFPYSSQVAPPFSQNMQRWRAMQPGSNMQPGYGAGSSRQLANAPYMHYATRVPEPQSFWPPPTSQGVVHNSNQYHYDTRQYR